MERISSLGSEGTGVFMVYLRSGIQEYRSGYSGRFLSQQPGIIDTSIIHGALAVIANEVKQSSKTTMHLFKGTSKNSNF
jgi:hypothetical protein